MEEQMLFLRRGASTAGAIDAIVDRLEAEHAVDADLAHELADTLELLAESGATHNPDLLRCRLRDFVESQRHHIDWEDDVLLPLALQVLSIRDLVELQSWIMASGRPACIRHSLTTLRELRDGVAVCTQCAFRAARPPATLPRWG
jgi:hemerythrin-like domain-containing protein